jgi:transcriptional regulator with XRE-family HTH domain
MNIAARLKQIRTMKNLSQGDVEKRTKLRRCYISRVENGFTVPSLETLEKFAKAFEVPLYQLFYEGQKPVDPIPAATQETLSPSQIRLLRQIAGVLPKVDERFHGVILQTTKQLAKG